MNISKFSIQRPVVTMMIIISMTILGLLTLINLKTELMPNANLPTARIRVRWSGASPDDMENLVTRKIEDGIASVEGIKRVTTRSKMDYSYLSVEFDYGVNIDNKVNDLTTAVNRIRNDLPEDIDEPIVNKTSFSSDRVMLISLSGPDLVALKVFADNIMIPRFQRITGVGSVDIDGGTEREIRISIDPNKLESYGLNIKDLYDKLKKASINFPAGYVREGDKEYLVRVFGEVKTLEDVKDIVIKNENGETLYLSDVADVRLDVKDRTSYGRTNSEENIVLNIEKTDVGNTVDISKTLREELKRLEPILPSGAKVSINRDYAVDINNSISAVKGNAIGGLILATLILYAFLKDLRATFVVAIAIPVSIIATFGFFGSKDISLNIMSLMGLSLGVGMLVDNSVVVMDNIFRHLTELGHNRVDASDKGATEVIVPIIASTATTVAVFFPVILREGRAKELYQDMCFSIIFSLLASLIIALTFVPMICSKILKDKNRVHEDGKFLIKMKAIYERVLAKALNFRVYSLVSVVALFLIFVVYGGSKVGGEFFPQVDDGVYSIVAEMPSGMDVDKPNKIAKEMEEIISKLPPTKTYTTTVKKDAISIVVQVGYKSQREDRRSIFEIMNEARKSIQHIPNLKLNVVPKMAIGTNTTKDIEFILKSDNIDQMTYVSNHLIKKMYENKGFTDISSTFTNGNPEARLILDRDKLEQYGIDVNDLTMSVSYQILGGAPITIKTLNEELDITLRLDNKYRGSTDLLLDTRIKTKNGASVKLKDVARMEIKEGPWSIDKEDKIAIVTIKANTLGAMDLKRGQDAIKNIIEESGIPSNITYEFTGDGRAMKEISDQLSFALVVSLFLIYFILAAQFESYILPLIVMVTVPLAVTGVYMGLLTFNQKNNSMVFIGIIMLAGIVVNNAIVLIDYVKILIEQQGYPLKEAILEAGKTRLRPIFMTTMTTVIGMVPLALGLGQGSERYKGMAIAVIFGLTFSTMLTLVIVPIMFEIYYETLEKIKKRFGSYE